MVDEFSHRPPTSSVWTRRLRELLKEIWPYRAARRPTGCGRPCPKTSDGPGDWAIATRNVTSAMATVISGALVRAEGVIAQAEDG
jgi:hypothetical protein